MFNMVFGYASLEIAPLQLESAPREVDFMRYMRERERMSERGR